MPTPVAQPMAFDLSEPSPPPRTHAKYAATLTAALDIISARLMLFITSFGAIGLFGFAAWQPTNLRMYVAIAYAATVLWPMAWLHLRKG